MQSESLGSRLLRRTVRVEHHLEEMVKAESAQQLASQSGALMNLGRGKG